MRTEFEHKEDPYPEESMCVAAGLIFAPAKIIQEVPYDPDIVFWGEEVTFSMRAWLRGWRIYSAKEWIASHHYTRDKTHPRIQDLSKKYITMDKVSTWHQMEIWSENYLGIWGSPELGGVDRYSKFVDINMKAAMKNREWYMKGGELENKGVDMMEWMQGV